MRRQTTGSSPQLSDSCGLTPDHATGSERTEIQFRDVKTAEPRPAPPLQEIIGMTWHVSLGNLVVPAFRRVSITEAAERSLTDDRPRGFTLSAYCYIPLQLLWPMLTSTKGWLRCYHCGHEHEEHERIEASPLTRKLLPPRICGGGTTTGLPV